MAGIVSYGAYIPIYRMDRALLAQVWGSVAGSGEKAIANFDEDTITMAVEATLDSLSGRDRDRIGGLYFATTRPPYREKQCATIIASAANLRTELFTGDFTNSLRSGTIAMRAALDAVMGGSAKEVVVVAADCRVPAPDSEFEPLFGDGAAALVIGDTDVAVEVEGIHTVFSEFMDTWRKEKDTYLLTWEDRFVFEEGYSKILPEAVFDMMKKLGLTTKDYAKAIFFAPDARRHAAMARTLGLDVNTQVQPHLFDTVGHTGTALCPMMLVAALEEARPGDRILLANYSDGADALSLRVTEHIEKIRARRGIRQHLESKVMLPNYGKYLRFRDLMEWESERRIPDRSALTVLWRERREILRFYAGRCRQCGTIQYPIQRVCAVCQSKDDYEEIRLADKQGTLFTFSLDERAAVRDLPNVACIVDFDGGGRYYGVLTDRDPTKLEVGMKVEMTLRNLHQGSGINNYAWKARPVRC